LTKAERLAQFKTQQAMSPAPAQHEQIRHYGDVFVRRALRQVRDAGAAWVLDIWVKDAKVGASRRASHEREEIAPLPVAA